MRNYDTELHSYVSRDLVEFLDRERGTLSRSTYVREILVSYMEMCNEEDQKGVNENQKMVVA